MGGGATTAVLAGTVALALSRDGGDVCMGVTAAEAALLLLLLLARGLG